MQKMSQKVKGNGPKVDRRVQRTRESLRKALLELVKERGYDTLSVEQITQRANVGRATFYLHYKDKEDLLMEEFSEMATERVHLISAIPFARWLPEAGTAKQADGPVTTPPLQIIFEHVAENAELYRIFIRGENAQRLSARLREIVARAVAEFVETKAQTEPNTFVPEIPVELLAAYFSGALLSCIDWWLEQRLCPSPVELTRIFQRLFFPGAGKVLGIGTN